MAKILALVTFKIYPPEMGGQKGVADFYEHLAKHHEVILAVSSDNKVNRGNVYPILFPNRQIFKNLLRIGRLKSIARKHEPWVIIAEHSYPAWIAWMVATRLNIPFIIHSHNIEALRFRKMRRRWWKAYWHYERWIHGKADHNFFISQDDLDYALREFSLDPSRCSVITYGIDETTQPGNKSVTENIFLFNGSLDYSPNEEAVHILIDRINPLLRQKLQHYRIVITGKGASPELVEKIRQTKEIEFLGYVPDLGDLFSRSAVFLNPVLNNTGIKTKVVEAIGHHCTVVSTESGAAGMQKDVCGEKLKVVADHDWEGFAEAVVQASKLPIAASPPEFFNFYSWRNIAHQAATIIQETSIRYIKERY